MAYFHVMLIKLSAKYVNSMCSNKRVEQNWRRNKRHRYGQTSVSSSKYLMHKQLKEPAIIDVVKVDFSSHTHNSEHVTCTILQANTLWQLRKQGGYKGEIQRSPGAEFWRGRNIRFPCSAKKRSKVTFVQPGLPNYALPLGQAEDTDKVTACNCVIISLR